MRRVLSSHFGVSLRKAGGFFSLSQCLSFVMLGILLLLASCGGEEEEEVDLTTFSGLYQEYFASCGLCHAPDREADAVVPGFYLQTEELAYEALLSRVDLRESCDTVRYVVPGQPDSSFIVAILDASTQASFAGTTGTNCAPLLHTLANGGKANDPSSSVLSGLRQWIRSGAQK